MLVEIKIDLKEMIKIVAYLLGFLLGNILGILLLFSLGIDIRDYTNRDKNNDKFKGDD